MCCVWSFFVPNCITKTLFSPDTTLHSKILINWKENCMAVLSHCSLPAFLSEWCQDIMWCIGRYIDVADYGKGYCAFSGLQPAWRKNMSQGQIMTIIFKKAAPMACLQSMYSRWPILWTSKSGKICLKYHWAQITCETLTSASRTALARNIRGTTLTWK